MCWATDEDPNSMERRKPMRYGKRDNQMEARLNPNQMLSKILLSAFRKSFGDGMKVNNVNQNDNYFNNDY